MHYYKFNIGDYVSHTQHLEPLEDIAYRRMLDWLYLNEMPLPSDEEEIGRLIRMRPHTDCIAVVLQEFFSSRSDGFTHVRVERELAAYQEKSDKAKKSAEARWKKKPSDSKGSGDANALHPECEGNAKQEPLNSNQEPKSIPAKPKYNEEDIRFAQWIADSLPDIKKPNIESWANTVRLMREVDKRNHKDMGAIWLWARSDHFWQANILSAEKFRKQYDTLVAQSKRPAGSTGYQTANEKAAARSAQTQKMDSPEDLEF